ncbi:flavin reductase [Bradyrhizobium commune]|uniref:Flavin reductase n=1 Tax=Bradyrhizobium commune TaxID=83627 RepID=A0A7S9H0W3_9BRAD|nr:flavin reductase [Bradyrhizobium commune]QPF92371.1 flavin reductase [Bradyrhizobium commune]
MTGLSEAGVQKRFRDAMARLGAAVNIVTTDGPAGRHGLTASAVCSVTDTPPTVLVCVRQQAGAHDVLKANGALCVNVLAGRHENLSAKFGRSGLSVDQRFADATWKRLATGAPALADAAASLDCRIVGVTEVGTHTVFFCEVQDMVAAAEPEGLIYFNRTYHHIGPIPQSQASEARA